MASLRRWEYADCSPRLPAVNAVYSPKLSARGAKAMRDLRPLAAKRPVETLEAAEAWSICSTPQKEQLSQPSQGLELSEASRTGFFGRLTGLDVEAELQRQALLLKSLLRDVAVLRDTVWHLADERGAEAEASEATKELRLGLEELQQEVRQMREGYDAKASLESETRYEETHWEAFEEHQRSLQQLEEHHRRLDERLQEQNGAVNEVNERFEEHHRRLDERLQEHGGAVTEQLEDLQKRLRELDALLLSEVEARQNAFEASRVSAIRSVSSRLAEEVAENACQSVTPELQRLIAAARPSTCPAALTASGALGGPAPRPAAPDEVQVAAQVAAELIQLLLSDWRRTPSPQEL